MKTRAEITFGMVDVTAKDDSSLTVNDKQNFVDLNDLKSDEVKEILYGTFEKNQFNLNGEFELMPEEEKLTEMCWWSNEMSDENGIFSTPLVMEIDFTTVHSSSGLTFTFSKANDYCNNLNIKFYDINGNIIDDVNFTPNSYIYACRRNVENYAKIIITFYGTNNPYRYLKLYKILYGTEEVFSYDNLITANVFEEIDLLSNELTINTLDFTLYSDNDDFNILNPQGNYKLLQQNQKITCKEFIQNDTKEVDMGTFYLSVWANTDDKIMEFEAQDMLGVLDTIDFYGGLYDNIRFEDLIKEIMLTGGFKDTDYIIQDDLKDMAITGHVPICTCKEALQYAIFRIGAIADCSRGSQLKIYTTNKNIISSILSENKTVSTQKIEQNDLITNVVVTSHNYTKSTNEEELFKSELNQGDNIITFSDPVCDLTITNGILKEYNCNYAIVNCSDDNAEVIINGYKYIDNQVNYEATRELNAGEVQNNLKVEDNYLIDKNCAKEIAERILQHYIKTYKISFDNILTELEKNGNYTELEYEQYEQKIQGFIIKQDIDLTGGFISSTEMIAEVVS